MIVPVNSLTSLEDSKVIVSSLLLYFEITDDTVSECLDNVLVTSVNLLICSFCSSKKNQILWVTSLMDF